MNKSNVEELEQELQTRYNSYEVAIEFTGAVALFFKIQNLKSLVSQQTILLSNGEYKELEIQVDMITDLRITENSIIIDMFDNYSIEITKVDEKKEFPTVTGGEISKEENVKCEI